MRNFYLTLTLAALLLSACSPRLLAPSGAAGAPAAPAAVERFLQMVGDRDYGGMGWVFGTSEGTIMQRDPVGQVEQRMYALASLLEHDSFVVGNSSPIPGRTGDAMRFDVVLRRGLQVQQVPFTVVRGPESRWYVEEIAVQSITGG